MFSALVKIHGPCGLSVQLNSMLGSSLNDALEEVYGKSKRKGQAGVSDQIVQDHINSQVGSIAYDPIQNDDDYQYDGDDEQLMAKGHVFKGGREIRLTQDNELLEMLALHLYHHVSEIVNADSGVSGRLLRESKGRRDGKKKSQSIVWFFSRIYFNLVGARLLTICFQSLLARKLHIILPLLFKQISTKKQVAKVIAYVDHRYLDPEKFEEHLVQRSRELLLDLWGADELIPE